jgi:outer membrane receptor for ferrienterochelin and colicin
MKKQILLVFFTMQALALLVGQDASILDQRVKGGYEEETIEFILRDLNLRYFLEIKYNADLLPDERLTFSFKDRRIRDVLNIILKDVAFDYVLNKEQEIVIAPSSLISEEKGLKNKKLADEQEVIEQADKILFGNPAAGNFTRVTLDGQIRDKETYVPVTDALIINKTNGDFTISDADGYFKIELEPGLYEFNISSLSHESMIQQVEIYQNDFWEIAAPQKAHLIEEVVISGKGAEHNVRETISGLEILSKKDIKKLPTFMGEADIIKSLLSLSGVSTIGEGSSGFNVRGGAIDQNLILYDNAIVFNPSHVLGFFSAFNPDIISYSSLHKGHIPANYGGRASSVLDVSIKEARMDQLSLSGSVGLISSKLTAEIPLIEDQTSLLVAGRTSYAKWLIKDIEDLDIKRSKARFGDFNLKLTHKFNGASKLNASFFTSDDLFQFSNEFGYSWQNLIGSLQYNHLFNDKFSLTANATYGKLNNEQFEPEGNLSFSLFSGIQYVNTKIQFLQDLNAHLLTYGLEGIQYDVIDEELEGREESIINERSVSKDNGREMAIFANDEFRISDKFSINAGLRFSFYQQTGPATINQYEDLTNPQLDEILSQEIISSGNIINYSGIEPRLSMRYSFSENTSAKLSLNRTRQYIHLVSNTATPTPVDIWQMSNTYIQPLNVKAVSAGLFFSTESGYDISAEAYYKDLENTLDYEDFSTLLLNPHLETAVIRGIGRNYGFELSLNKNTGPLTARTSYSYARSEHRTTEGTVQVNGGNWFPSNFDQPHNFKFSLDWQATKRDRFSLNFVYNTGRPITAVTSNYLLQGIVVPNFSSRNNFRLPDYHRLDLSYTFTLNRLKSARWQSEFNISLYNVYGRKNPFSIFYQQEIGSQINALKLSVVGTAVPSISYNFKW